MSLKEAYQQKMEAKIREWSAEIDLLKAKADKAGAGQKIKYQETLESLRRKKQNLRNELDKLHSPSEVVWEEFKSGVDHAWEELKKSVERAQEKFK